MKTLGEALEELLAEIKKKMDLRKGENNDG